MGRKTLAAAAKDDCKNCYAGEAEYIELHRISSLYIMARGYIARIIATGCSIIADVDRGTDFHVVVE
jgi:hypothetical protein